MAGFDLLELFLYVFPILQMIFIHFFFRPYLQYGRRIKLSITDTTVPILMIGIHILSVRLLTYSLLPHFLFVVFIIGLISTVLFEHAKKERTAGKVFSFVLKLTFLLGFFVYYGLVGCRIFQVLRG